MFFKYNWPGILWLIIIFLLTGFPGDYFPRIQTFWNWLGPDKIAHLILFGIFIFLLIRGFRKQSSYQHLKRNYIIYALGIGIIFGAITEVMQRYVFIGRNANIYDFLANVAGCLLGLAVYYLVNRKLNKNIGIINN